MTGKTKNKRLWQEISLALAIKVIVLLIIWLVWFSLPEDQTMDANQVSSHFFLKPSAKEQNHDPVR